MTDEVEFSGYPKEFFKKNSRVTLKNFLKKFSGYPKKFFQNSRVYIKIISGHWFGHCGQIVDNMWTSIHNPPNLVRFHFFP